MRSAINRLHKNGGGLKSTYASICPHNCNVANLNNSNGPLETINYHRVMTNTRSASNRIYSTRLAEVGRFETKQADEDFYVPGQPFLHQIFGYRGVILFPWLARVHDIDVRKKYNNNDPSKTKSQPSESHRQDQNNDSSQENGNDKVTQSDDRIYIDGHIPASRMNANSTIFHPYYQVLIDTRDCDYVSNRTQTEAVTFLGHPDNSKSVYSIKGLDYVAHEDILPYTSYEETPIHHELHGKFFRFNQEPGNKTRYEATDLLESWRNKHPWFDLSRVYKETTENVRVTVIPFYLGHTTIEDISFHWWRYCVRLENFSDSTVQLRERNWKIFSQTNMLQTIKGRGVVGVEPILSKYEPAYQYSSHVNLQDKSGHMWGTFKMQREDGHSFECRIPPFSLESTSD